jgi:hypothetical protein
LGKNNRQFTKKTLSIKQKYLKIHSLTTITTNGSMIPLHLSKYNPTKRTIFNTPNKTKLIKIKEKYTLKHPYSKA